MIFMSSFYCCFYTRPKDTKIEKEEKRKGRQATENRFHGRAATETESRVSGQSLHNGAAETVAGPGTQPQ